ncbi:MAG: hypothetical protein M3312_04150 [Actinomycetota bacterium]|nr:hypothetical protein [Actinomycetota bacterium]
MSQAALAAEAGSGRAARAIAAGLAALAGYGLLTFLGTLSHQPDYQTHFREYAGYVTTTSFLLSHLVASIVGTTLAILGVIALSALVARPAPRLALAGLVLSVVGLAFILTVIGAAAFAQPAIGDAYLAGQKAAAERINDGVYGTATFAIALPGVLAYSLGAILLGIAIWRSPSLPPWAGVLYGASAPLIAIFGLAIGIAQTIGAALLVVAVAWIGWSVLHSERADQAPSAA